MALKQWCGKPCDDCKGGCKLDTMIPCSPECDGLTSDGKIKVKECLKFRCDALESVFGKDIKILNDKEIIKKYGEIADYPYKDLPDGCSIL